MSLDEAELLYIERQKSALPLTPKQNLMDAARRYPADRRAAFFIFGEGGEESLQTQEPQKHPSQGENMCHGTNEWHLSWRSPDAKNSFGAEKNELGV